LQTVRARDHQPEIDATKPTSGLEVRTIADLTSTISMIPVPATSKLGEPTGVYGHYVGFELLDSVSIRSGDKEGHNFETGIAEMIFRIVRVLVEDHLTDVT